ncbi:Permease of the drug/metabolite transporter (DMT) superfamily [Olavius algarvensis associated proteobacterium Delta 3]|nr:Permease of the drug/metabolite transporter (DMT) superfamily [Olavius algarvensis associated proteobacterium Delta 3]CAB5132641.1 Permease of the drug/metabolite transporter (DMT) superfamily [Olavius algarvensis associated proteobacterium Delta 3]
MGLWHTYASLAYLAVFLGVCGHASTEFVAVLSGVSGPELSVWRFVLGGLGLVLLSLLFPASRDLTVPFRTHGMRLVWLSILGITVGYLLFHWSLDFATVPQVATVVTTIPIFVGLANLVINKQPFTGAKIISGLCAMIGVALLITDGYLAKLAGVGENLIGIFMVMGCAGVVAAYTVLVRPIIVEYGALRITAITMSIGAVGLWLVVGLFWNIWVNPFTLFDRPSSQVASLLTIAVWNTTITQFLWIGGLAAVPDITRGSYLFFLKPVIAAFLAVLFLSQKLTAWQVLAIAVICASVLVEVLWARLFPTKQPASS